MISVILPVYKVEKYISNCIKSIIEQDYKEFEIILVDDGSPDNSIAIAEELLKSEEQINYQVIHTENRGVSAARNVGIRASRGDYLVMVDSDDILLPGFLSTYIKIMTDDPDLNIYSTGFQVIEENKKFETRVVDNLKHVLTAGRAQEQFFFRKTVFLLPTLLLKRKFVISNNIFFDENVRYSEDVQFIWKCLGMNEGVVIHSNVKNYMYILHAGSTMTSSDYKKISTGFEGLEELFPALQPRLVKSIVNDFYSLYSFNLIHGASHILDYSSYKALCRKYNLKFHYKMLVKLFAHVDVRVKAISGIACLFPLAGYKILNKF